MAALQFAPWSSDIDLSFYASLASVKVNHDKLDDAAKPVMGRYEVRPNDAPERSARMQIHGDALSATDCSQGQYRAFGSVRNFNTIEEYKALDRAKVMEEAGRKIWDAINDDTIYKDPSVLAHFHAIFFADLKKYKYTYHFAFPALHADPSWKLESNRTQELSEATTLHQAVQQWKAEVKDSRQHGFFLAKHQTSTETGSSWKVAALSEYENGFLKDHPAADSYICFADPSTYPQNPAWMLRNLLILAKHRWNLSTVQVLCFRDSTAPIQRTSNLILTTTSALSSAPLTFPKTTGWERSPSGTLTSRQVDLSAYLDPKRLADQSVDLNLKLMKWRIAPDLDLDIIKNTSCLLLGAGTLGSYVARNLLGWGVRRITFVDSGRVSFSNPVRQPLFTYADCLDGGASKAERAAAALRDIYPGVDASGHTLSVPMAGHAFVSDADEAAVQADYERLLALIDAHDAIFLLMDSRESRWLPTLAGKARRKLVLNAALGFDSYVVMRHGAEAEPNISSPAAELGCYFCTDVVAPADSMRDRTLDQQCTVTRPGVAAIASALLVELAVSVLQHPLGAACDAPLSKTAQRDSWRSSDGEETSHPLGLVPHSIRGFLAGWENLVVRGPAYGSCSACGPAVVEAFRKDGWAFVRRVLNERGFVEEVSGLAEVQRRAEAAAREIEDFSDGSVGEIDDEDGELL